MKKLIFIPALALLLLSSCERDAKIDVPVTPPMMAVYAFVEAGQPLQIRVEEVVPLFSKPRRDPESISGATVVVSDGTQTYLFQEGGTPGTYENPTFIGTAGESYELEVIRASFPSLKASCQVPTYSPASIDFDYVSTPDNSGFGMDSSRRIGFRWKDTTGVANFYRFAATAQFSTGSTNVEFSNKNTNDKGQDGQEVLTGLAPIYYYNPSQPSNSLRASIDLMTVDEHTARYMITYDANWYNGDNPFGEPVMMYTNVKGGIGIFGGVKRSYYQVQVY